MRIIVQSERHSSGLSPSASPGQNRSVAYPPLLQAALDGDRVHPATPHCPEEMVAHAGAIENTLHEAGVAPRTGAPRRRHRLVGGHQRPISRGHGIRTGLEDTPVLPDGRQAQGNSELIAAAAAMQRRRLAMS
jgi:uncharacterized protein (DUF849 family)